MNFDPLADEMPTPPDLQKLVEQFGGYDKITPEAWAAYDRQLEVTQAWLRDKHKPLKRS